ncbi:hypothetical protein CC78DRAFT_586056 [Lojkania enalia]|uniref:Glycerate dehydrogenase n=1 Tax=Lojkania enalia TaxID=147567 RepID=A0A9P4K0Z0_9PLEO|nr:hypothetical protein CC78DRAFT_586056 [Didymosphaeria enalia]
MNAAGQRQATQGPGPLPRFRQVDAVVSVGNGARILKETCIRVLARPLLTVLVLISAPPLLDQFERAEHVTGYTLYRIPNPSPSSRRLADGASVAWAFASTRTGEIHTVGDRLHGTEACICSGSDADPGHMVQHALQLIPTALRHKSLTKDNETTILGPPVAKWQTIPHSYPMHHEIVALEGLHQPLPPTFTFPPHSTYNLTVYRRPDLDRLRDRIRNATIIIVTTIKLSADVLAPDVTPSLRLVAVMATGTDPVDLDACRKRGVRVTNCPAANIDAVSEHAISLYFAARRRTVLLDGLTRRVPSEWKEKRTLMGHLRFADGKPPLTCGEEVLGIVGYGALGKRIAALGCALGMRVLVAARKNPSSNGVDVVLPPTTEDDRVPFEEVVRQSTVLALSLPRNAETLNLISTPEFELMSPYAVLVNVSRGGIVDEDAVVKAVREGRIAGYATDVLDKEPAEGPQDSPLLSDEVRDLNITLSPHLAWFSQRTLKNLGQILKDTVEAWVQGRPINVIV